MASAHYMNSCYAYSTPVVRYIFFCQLEIVLNVYTIRIIAVSMNVREILHTCDPVCVSYKSILKAHSTIETENCLLLLLLFFFFFFFLLFSEQNSICTSQEMPRLMFSEMA